MYKKTQVGVESGGACDIVTMTVIMITLRAVNMYVQTKRRCGKKRMGRFFSRSPRLCHGREHRNKEIVLIGNGKNAEAPCLLHSFGFFRVSPRQVAERAAKQLLDRKKKCGPQKAKLS
uniref:Uncharacterized protein n=1 Tax=Rhipicephalus zambeziensis TaxID=60191 RepID=A0A224YJF5_9ACAR